MPIYLPSRSWPTTPPAGYRIDPTHPLARGLVAYWLMDEPGGIRRDATGRGNDLTPVGASVPGSAVGPLGRQARLTGNHGFSLADNSQWAPGSFTAMVDVSAQLSGNNWYCIAAKGDEGSHRQWMLWHAYNGGKRDFTFDISADGATRASRMSTTFTPVSGSRYVVLAWYDAVAGTASVQVSGGAVQSAASTAGLADSAYPLTIGSRASTDYWLIGTLGPGAYWRRVLTPAERAQLYTDPFAFFAPRRSGLWVVEWQAPEDGATHEGTASLTALASVSAAGNRVAFGASELSASADLAAQGTRLTVGEATLAAQLAVDGSGVRVAIGAALVSAQAMLTAVGMRVAIGQAAVSAQATIEAVGVRVVEGVASLAATLTVRGSDVVLTPARVLLARARSLDLAARARSTALAARARSLTIRTVRR